MKAAARLLLILALVAPAFASAQQQTTAPAPTCKLFAGATTVKPNTKVRLDWTTTNATNGYLTEVGTIASKGTVYVVPGKNTTYAASFTGPGGSVVCRVAVAVSASAPTGGTGGGTVDGGGTIDTSANPIDTNRPVNLDRTVNLGGNVTLPTVPSVAPNLSSSGGGGGLLGGIVPAECRGSSTVANCDLCSLAQMGQNLANFLLGITIPAAALLFAWAGILFFSSRGSPEQITRARKIFMSVVIGFVIAVSAWVLVNTVMNMLIQGGDWKSWNWQTLNCTETRKARLYNMSLSQYLTSSLPSLQSYTGSTGSSDDMKICPEGSELDGGRCFDTTGGRRLDIGPATSGDGSEWTSCPTGYVYETSEGGYCRSTTDGDKWVEACPTGYTYEASEGGYCQNLTNPNLWVETDGSLSGAGASYTTQQNVWLSACRNGDAQSCQNFSNSSGSGELGARIGAATQQYVGTDTSAGPDGGNLACAWAVNNILRSSGIAPIGDGVGVESMEAALRNGRGTSVPTSNAVPGDIIVWKEGRVSHVGVCETAGCTTARSNSSGNASFSNIHTSTVFRGVQGRIYHVNN